jgi:hypothetical protein
LAYFLIVIGSDLSAFLAPATAHPRRKLHVTKLA